MRRAVVDGAGMLRKHGFCDFTAELQPGDVQITVPDEFSLAPGKWHTPDGGQTWQEYTAPPSPQGKPFEGALKTIFANDPVALNTLLVKYPLFLWSLRDQNWAYVEHMLIGALAANDLTPQDYAAIKAAAAEKHIPITLP